MPLRSPPGSPSPAPRLVVGNPATPIQHQMMRVDTPFPQAEPNGGLPVLLLNGDLMANTPGSIDDSQVNAALASNLPGSIDDGQVNVALASNLPGFIDEGIEDIADSTTGVNLADHTVGNETGGTTAYDLPGWIDGVNRHGATAAVDFGVVEENTDTDDDSVNIANYMVNNGAGNGHAGIRRDFIFPPDHPVNIGAAEYNSGFAHGMGNVRIPIDAPVQAENVDHRSLGELKYARNWGMPLHRAPYTDQDIHNIIITNEKLIGQALQTQRIVDCLTKQVENLQVIEDRRLAEDIMAVKFRLDMALAGEAELYQTEVEHHRGTLSRLRSMRKNVRKTKTNLAFASAGILVVDPPSPPQTEGDNNTQI